MNTREILASALAALACAGPVHAHHSGRMYVTTPIWLKGTVVAFEAVNPHTKITLEERTADGKLRRWAIEGPGDFQLDRLGLAADAPQIGDSLEFCAFPYKSLAELARLSPGVDFTRLRASSGAEGSSPQFVAGHVMVMPDGTMRVWEPHGILSECMRSADDRRQAWLGFFESDVRARDAWCMQKAYSHVQSTPSLQAIVEEIDRSIGDLCE